MSFYVSYSPGDGWFQHVETDNPNVLIPGITHAQNYHNGYMELSNWTLEQDAYISHMNNGDIHLNSEKHIFFVEKSEVSIFSQGGPRYHVMVFFLVTFKSDSIHFILLLIFV